MVPEGADCLSFDFKFFSEEWPTPTQFNDAFVAELDVSDWTTSGAVPVIDHPSSRLDPHLNS